MGLSARQCLKGSGRAGTAAITKSSVFSRSGCVLMGSPERHRLQTPGLPICGHCHDSKVASAEACLAPGCDEETGPCKASPHFGLDLQRVPSETMTLSLTCGWYWDLGRQTPEISVPG